MGGCFSGEDKRAALDSSRWSDCSLDEFEKRVNPLIDNIKLSKYKRNILKKRYTKLVIFYENYAADINRKYNICRIIISVGSMILPTLQTIQNNETVASIKDEIFWAAIGTSLSVMISNNLISMFSLDRRYIMYAVTAEKLKAVGWKYFELSDMFSNKTHIENWILFWNEVEKIKKLQVIAEFTDNDDKQNHEPNPANDKSPINSDSESYDSEGTPRKSNSHRRTPRHRKTPREIESPEVIIDLDEREENINKSKLSFKEKFNNIGALKNDIENNIENNIKENVNEKISQSVSTGQQTNEVLGKLGEEIHENIKKE